MPIKQVYKSKNFDKYLDGKRLTKNAKAVLFKNVSLINTTARRDFVPVATRATINSMRMQTKQGGSLIELESINHGGKRYDNKKANGAYKIRGKTIPAGANAGRFQWYDKAEKVNHKKIIDNAKGAIYD